MIDIAQQDLRLVKSILLKHLSHCEVRVFGSRVTGTATKYSDLDLVIVGKQKIDRSVLNRLQDEFEYSDLPFRVEVLDWHRISDNFRKIIEQNYEIIISSDSRDLSQ